MKATKILLAAALGAGLVLAQAPATLSAGTKVDAKLQSRLNAQQAKVGDPVTAVTTAAVKEKGRVVLPKGTRLSGRVTSVLAAKDAQAPSRVGIVFDQATTAQGQTVPVHFVIAGVTRAAAQTEAMPPEPMLPPPAPMPMPAAGGASGALGLGGAVLAPVGGAVAGAGAGLGAAAAMPMPLPPVQVTQPALAVGAAAGADAGSELSVPHGNLMLASGTRLRLVAAGGGH